MSSYRINVKTLAQSLLRASICVIIFIIPLLLSTQFVSVQAGRSLARRQCSTNSQCGGYKVCYYGSCMQPCWTNGDCGGGPCVNGICGGGGGGSGGGSSGSGSGSGGSGSGNGGSGTGGSGTGGSGTGGSGTGGSGTGGSGTGGSGSGSNDSSSGGNTESLSGNSNPNSGDDDKPFFSKPIGKAVLAVSLLILTMFILIALFWCYRSRSKRKDKNHKTRGIPASMSKSRVTPAPSQPSILTESKAPEPFLEPEMMTPISPSSGNQLDNASTASAAVAAQSSRQPKRSYTIYGTQGASTSSVELSGTSNTYYPIVQQHHFMSSEHEPWE